MADSKLLHPEDLAFVREVKSNCLMELEVLHLHLGVDVFRLVADGRRHAKIPRMLRDDMPALMAFASRFHNLTMVCVSTICLRGFMSKVSSSPEKKQEWSNNVSAALIGLVRGREAVDWSSSEVNAHLAPWLCDLSGALALSGFGFSLERFHTKNLNGTSKARTAATIQSIVEDLICDPTAHDQHEGGGYALITPAIMEFTKELVGDFNVFLARHWGRNKDRYQLALNASNT